MIRQDSLFLPSLPLDTISMAETMLFGEPDPDLDSGHILDWLEDSMPSLPSLFDDLYGSTNINDDWWGLDPFEANNISTSNSVESLASPVSSTFTSSPVDAYIVYDEPQEPVSASDVSKKRKAPDDHIQMTKTAPQAKRSKDLYGSADISDDWWGTDPFEANNISTSNSVESLASPVSSAFTSSPVEAYIVYDEPQELVSASDVSKKRKAPDDHIQMTQTAPQAKRSNGNKKGNGKSTKENSSSGNNKGGRWAEQLLNPCASAISSGNVTRVQHLLFVLQELASPTGDANYRLASHGMQALLHHISSATNTPAKVMTPAITFATSTPKFFQKSLINFNDINPWFTIPNNIANNAILQVLSEQDQESSKTLHILDIGVSHGFQWPTLLEALSRRPGGPPPLVRLTVVPPILDNHQIPFANCPPGYDFASNIYRFAKDLNINLQINQLDNCPLQSLNSEVISSSPDETLIVCAQFRLHGLNHTKPDNRTDFLKLIRNMDPQAVILNDNNMDCSCTSCSNFDTRFSLNVDYLWSFLDSTSVAFKGREMEERKLLEGEAAKVLISTCEMNEKKEKWGERMNSAGFLENAFAEDVVDQARALLKKYDSHWEMRVDENDGSVGLWWKGQSVSFCSLWKIDAKTSYSYSV